MAQQIVTVTEGGKERAYTTVYDEEQATAAVKAAKARYPELEQRVAVRPADPPLKGWR